MLIKKKQFYYYYLENEEVTFNINNWETPFGLEQFGKKTIINLIIPKNNNGLNLINTINQISDEILKEENEFAKKPIKEGSNTLIRCEYLGKNIYNKNDKVNGLLKFKIYNFKGNWGISVILY